MFFFPRLKERQRQPEVMDQPDLDPAAFVGSLRALERINYCSGSARILWQPIRALAQQIGPRPLQLLDVATGAGDVPIRLWHKARRAGLAISLAGCDRNPTAIAHASDRARQQGADVRFFVLDALKDVMAEEYDVVCCSLFLHHLDADDAVELLRRMAAAARHLVLVNDLVRSSIGYALAYLGTRLLSRSPVAHKDGPVSVQGAFTPVEVLELARQAGLADASVARRWPWRLLLSWRRHD